MGSGTVRLISEWMSFSSDMFMDGSCRGRNQPTDRPRVFMNLL